MNAIAICDLEASIALDRETMKNLFGAGPASDFAVTFDSGWNLTSQVTTVLGPIIANGIVIGQQYKVTKNWRRVMKGKNEYHVTKWF